MKVAKGFVGLLLGVIFCALLFSYGVTQEVPIGQVEGTLILSETGKPFGGGLVTLSVKDDDSAPERYVTADAKGHFRFRNVKAGDYQIEVSAQEHKVKQHTVTIAEGRTLHLTMKLDPNAPYLKMYASQRVWAPGDPPQLELHGFRAGDSVQVEIDHVAFRSLLEDGNFTKAVKALQGGDSFTIPASFEKYSKKDLVFTHRVTNRDSEGAFVEPLNIPALPEGFYWVRCSGNGTKGAAYINVSHIALVTKTAHGQALSYVTDLVNGTPVGGAHIWSQSNDHIAEATSDADGLATTSFGGAGGDDSRATLFAVRGESVAAVGIYTSEDTENSGDAKIVMYTERPIYRPGDEVQFKGFIRQRSGLGYLPPTAGKVSIQINDTDDQPIQSFPLDVSAHGAFSGHFTTSKEAGPGLYRIVAEGADSSGSHFVHMVAYRKPEMSVQISPVRPYYFWGDKAQVAIQCSYYFGGPVVGAKLNVNVYASPEFQGDPEDDEEGGRSSYDGGDLTKTIQAVTDDKGQAIIQFDTRSPNEKNAPLSDLDFHVDVSATDAANKYVNSEGSVRVARGAYSLSVAAQNYLATPGQTFDVVVKTLSSDAGRAPVAGRALTVSTGTETWKDNKEVFTPTGEFQAATGPDGTVHLPIKAGGPGSTVVKVSSRDDAGRLLVSEDRVYVLGGKWHAEADQSRFDVVLDKRRYKMGETARVMLRTLVPGGSALVTAQTDRILWKKVVPLTGMATFVNVPIQANFLPNCFISVAYVHKKKFYEGASRLSVEPGQQKLDISVESDKQEVLPGGQVQLTVHTKDLEGHPVSADVSLGVVDESVYAIREDDFDVYEEFYPKRTNSVVTSYSFSEVYLDGGDKGGGNVAVRKKFMDTAAWIPSVVTDATGTAQVSVTLPDNLTQWRVTAVGMTDQTSVGKSTTKFRARKKLMVRLEMPEFLVQQDDRQMSVIITNDTGTDQEVQFSLDAVGVALTGDLHQTVHVPADKPANLTFGVKTGDPGLAKLTAKVWVVGGPDDGVEQSFPVLAHGVVVRDGWAQEVKDAADFSVPVGSGVDKTSGRLKITLSGGLAGNLVSSLDTLIGFPYGCVEQTMSRFMPSVLVAKAVRDLGVPHPKLEAEIPKIASDSMIRLARMQHEDGGWGWWENDASDPFMTALVLDGLDRCKTAGFEVHKVDVEKALTWCVNRVGSADWKKDSTRSQSYIVYVLARYGHPNVAAKAYGTILLRNLAPADRATLVLATNELGSKFAGERDRLLDRLTDLAHQGALEAYWDNSDWDWGAESTALALTAYMTVRPDDPIVRKIVRHLMNHRRGETWDSTRDTAYSLVGLTKYLGYSHEVAGKFQANVLLDGRLVKSVELDPRDSAIQTASVEVPTSDLHSGTNLVRIEKVGVGTCYAALDLQTTEIKATLPKLEPVPGFRVVRKYYKMEARKLEDGTMRLLPSRKPVTSVESGDVIRVELTVTSNKPRQFIMVEDPTPSNCRVTEREELDEGEEWSFWWDRLVIRDEKVAFFIRNLSSGTQVLTYTMQAEGLGMSHALPTSMSNMYDLKETASGAESLLEVK